MSGERYSLGIYDCAGEFGHIDCDDSFERLLFEADRCARAYPGKVLLAFNDDRVDYKYDGLTEDERDAVDAAIWNARHSAIAK